MKLTIRNAAIFLSNLLFKRFMRVKTLPVSDFDEKGVCPYPDKSIFVLRSKAILDEIAFMLCCEENNVENADVYYLPASNDPEAISVFFEQILQADTETIHFLPVSIFWGRTPTLGKGFWKSYLSDNWAVAGFFRRMLTVIIQIRQIHCYLGTGITIALDSVSDSVEERYKLIQQIDEQLIRQKEAVIGPDMSHQRIMADKVVGDAKVRGIINASGKEKSRIEKQAYAYIHEIASDYSYPVVRLFDYFLTWLWEKLYQGVEVKGMDRLQSIAEGHGLVYVPCHRSHIDYLLLSYVIYHQGLMPPHIAAGINLNLPVVGKLLRSGGAFFIRRKFRENKLYRAVLESYLGVMCKEGFSIEYFIEGGRSRTGLLLQPSSGMLSMTIQAAAQEKNRPLIFVPVYIGYEKLFESRSYAKELHGSTKKKESITRLFSARKYLKHDFGKVYLNIGNPISLQDVVRNIDCPPIEAEQYRRVVSDLGRKILTEINASSSVTAMNLIAVSLLGSPQYALFEYQLKLQMCLLKKLCQLPYYEDTLDVHEFSFEEAIQNAENIDLVKINVSESSKILFLDPRGQVSATFLKNNNLHVFILSSLIASIFVIKRKVTLKRLKNICLRIYPYLKAELFLPWASDGLGGLIEGIVNILIGEGVISYEKVFLVISCDDSEEYNALLLLAKVAEGNFQRFYITTRLLKKVESGYYTSGSLVISCVAIARNLSLLHESREPDFLDVNLFKTFIDQLIQQKLIICDDNGYLMISDTLSDASMQAHYVLSSSVRRSIDYVTQNSDKDKSMYVV